MTFEEWYDEQRNDCAFLKGHNGTISRKEIARMVQDHQQEIIDELRREIDRLREVEYMYNDLCD